MTTRSKARQAARRAAIIAAVARTGKSPGPALARRAAVDARKAMQARPGDKPGGRMLHTLNLEARNARTDDALTVKGATRGGTKRWARFGTLQTAGGILDDPARTFSYWVRNGLRATDPVYSPSACRVIDPATGAVKYSLDPVTRKVIQ